MMNQLTEGQIVQVTPEQQDLLTSLGLPTNDIKKAAPRAHDDTTPLHSP
jgi:hypothetical protein